MHDRRFGKAARFSRKLRSTVNLFVIALLMFGSAPLQTVLAAAPAAIGEIDISDTTTPAGSEITVSAPFTDADAGDTHTATWEWGDGTTSAGTVTAGSVSGSHAYADAGIYTIKLTLTGSDGVPATATSDDVMVFDPSNGYVFGGRRFVSQPGWFLPLPTWSGRAHYNVGAEYFEGEGVPRGTNALKLTITDDANSSSVLQFVSTSNDWMVLNGDWAQITGSGTNYGTGNYGFRISATDGQQPGGDGRDRMRIMIWDKAPEPDQLVYDNEPGQPVDARPTLVVPQFVINHKPIADAGGPYTMERGTSITLNAEVEDVDLLPNTYRWFLDGNSTIDSTEKSPAFPGNTTIPANVNQVTVRLQVCDQSGACGDDTAVVNIITPGPPIANTDEFVMNEDDEPVIIPVLANDIDPDHNPFRLVSITQPTGGTAVQNADGTVSYTPNPNYCGRDSFTYTVTDDRTDGKGGASDGSVFVEVKCINDAPQAINNSFNIDEDTVAILNVHANDVDIDNEIDAPGTINVTRKPAHGSTEVDRLTGEIIYTPNPNYTGPDSFTYDVGDVHRERSNEATVTIMVDNVNDAPVAGDDPAWTDEDVPVVVKVLENDSDVEGDTLAIESFTQPANGTTVENADGTITYTPKLDYHGEDSFSYTVTDSKGGSASATVMIAVATVNDFPIANDDHVTIDEDQIIVLDLLGNDTDPEGDPLRVFDILDYPAHGDAARTPEGVVTYTPNPGYHGSDSLSYQMEDVPGRRPATAKVFITIRSVNSAPIANDDSAQTKRNLPVTKNVLANDTDPDGDTFTVASFTQPEDGTLTWNGGNVTYTPKTDTCGVDTFTYTIKDGDGLTDTATVQITVECPAEGFVVGAGWFNFNGSKADFAFGALRHKGMLWGATYFQYKAKNITFYSIGNDSLVIDGARAVFKASGKVNGSSNYGIMITTIDGRLDGTRVDKVRIKVWNKANGQVLFDNQSGASEGAAPTQTLGCGEIFIYKGK